MLNLSTLQPLSGSYEQLVVALHFYIVATAGLIIVKEYICYLMYIEPTREVLSFSAFLQRAYMYLSVRVLNCSFPAQAKLEFLITITSGRCGLNLQFDSCACAVRLLCSIMIMRVLLLQVSVVLLYISGECGDRVKSTARRTSTTLAGP